MLSVVILSTFLLCAAAQDGPVASNAGVERKAEGFLAESEVCQQYPHLNLCQLHGVLRGAIGELDKLLLGKVEEGEEGVEGGKEKRKSAFVRFGKRKSAFVRFGKRSQDQEKRKSSYIRFG